VIVVCFSGKLATEETLKSDYCFAHDNVSPSFLKSSFALRSFGMDAHITK
jgi:hypothetical protein